MSDKVEAIRANIRENGHEACPSVGDVEHLLAALDAATAREREMAELLRELWIYADMGPKSDCPMCMKNHEGREDHETHCLGMRAHAPEDMRLMAQALRESWRQRDRYREALERIAKRPDLPNPERDADWKNCMKLSAAEARAALKETDRDA